jgi:valyl-tRNA synthetase
MRFTLASMTTDTQDVRMPVALMTLPDGRQVNTSPKFDIGRNFCNKLWNASRFAMMNLEGTDPAKFDASKMNAADKWILSRLANTVSSVTTLFDEFKFNEPLNAIYKFFWNDFCDWYLEWAKPRMQNSETKPIAQNVLAFVLDQTLRLLHPFVPFITETIFQKLNDLAPERGLGDIAGAPASDAIVNAQWPKVVKEFINEDIEQQIETVQGVIRSVRDIRSQYTISPKVRLKASAKAPQAVTDILNSNAELVCQLAGLESFAATVDAEKPANAAAAIIEGVNIFVHDVIDPEEERKRLEKRKAQIENGIKPLQGKLNNENFITRAKPEVVQQSKDKLAELLEQLAAIEKHISEL